jgi:Alpha/beta hydrolase family
VDKLHVDVFGAGDPAIFVHGSFGWGLDTFPEQRALSDEYRIILVDRRGFGGSSSLEAMGWPADMHDVAALLDDVGPAHLVGQSYGAVVALLRGGPSTRTCPIARRDRAARLRSGARRSRRGRYDRFAEARLSSRRGNDRRRVRG